MSGEGNETTRAAAKDERGADRLRRTTTAQALSVDLVSAFAGDRELTEAERHQLLSWQEQRGEVFYSDLFYAVTHQYIAPQLARSLWSAVLQHKHLMSELLGRNVRIAVATLDYLTNVTGTLASATLISEVYVTEIANLSMRDGMTGLYNHTSCYELLELEFRSHRRYGAGVALILLDIDEFKHINDQCGHQEGDRVLTELARMLRQQVRDSDICCRIGGEEFVVILPFTSSSAEAQEIAERIRESATQISCGEQAVTISAGVAVCDHATTTPRQLMDQADRALYRAKRNGRNRIAAVG